MLGLEVSLLRLSEVDDIPDCIEVLSGQVSNEMNGMHRRGAYIRLDVLVLQVEGLSESRKLETRCGTIPWWFYERAPRYQFQ